MSPVQSAIKEELGRVAAKPVKFQYFEKFTFKDKKVGPILLVGENAMKLITPVTKSGAVCRAANRAGLRLFDELRRQHCQNDGDRRASGGA